MLRTLACIAVVGWLLINPAAKADEVFPEDHHEPITVRLLSGRNGRPVPFAHVLLIGGYEQRDLKMRMWSEETLTDAEGRVRLSNQLANLPWLQVWANKNALCQQKPRQSSYSVALVRRDGVSAPNECGIVTVRERPGMLTVFVKAGKKALKLKKQPLVLDDEPQMLPAEAVKPQQNTAPTVVFVPTQLTPAPAPVAVTPVVGTIAWPLTDAPVDAPPIKAIPLVLTPAPLPNVPKAAPPKRSVRHKVVPVPSCPVAPPAADAKNAAAKNAAAPAATPAKNGQPAVAPAQANNKSASANAASAKGASNAAPPAKGEANSKPPAKGEAKPATEKPVVKTSVIVRPRRRVKVVKTALESLPKEAAAPAAPEAKAGAQKAAEAAQPKAAEAVPTKAEPVAKPESSAKPKTESAPKAEAPPAAKEAASAVAGEAPTTPKAKPSAGKARALPPHHGPPKDWLRAHPEAAKAAKSADAAKPATEGEKAEAAAPGAEKPSAAKPAAESKAPAKEEKSAPKE